MTLTVLTGPLNYKTTNHCELITKGTTEWTDTQRISTDPRFCKFIMFFVCTIIFFLDLILLKKFDNEQTVVRENIYDKKKNTKKQTKQNKKEKQQKNCLVNLGRES